MSAGAQSGDTTHVLAADVVEVVDLAECHQVVLPGDPSAPRPRLPREGEWVEESQSGGSVRLRWGRGGVLACDRDGSLSVALPELGAGWSPWVPRAASLWDRHTYRVRVPGRVLRVQVTGWYRGPPAHWEAVGVAEPGT